MKNHPRILTGAIGLALTISACSSDGVTRAEYLKSANKVCARLSSEREATAKKFFPGGTDKPPTVETMQQFYAEWAPLFSTAVEDLAAIKPPKKDRETVDGFIETGRQEAEVMRKAGDDTSAAQHLLETDEAELHADDKAMASFGFTC